MPNIINKSCCYLYLLLLLLLWTVGAARSVIGCEELVPVTTLFWLPARIVYLGEYCGHSRYRVSQKGKNLHSLYTDVPPPIFSGGGGTSVRRLKFAVWRFSLVGVCPLDDTPLDVICRVIVLEFPDVFWKYCVMCVCHCVIFLFVLFENIGTNPL